MKKEKLIVYLLEIVMIVFLFFTLFASNIMNRILLSLSLLVYYIVSYFILKKIKKKSVYERKTTILMLIFGIVYVALFYALGLYFGFEPNKYLLTFKNMYNIVIPIAAVIVLTELIRKKYLSQDCKIEIKGKKINVSWALIFIMTTMIDLALYLRLYDLGDIEDFLLVLGFIFFASASSNLFYNYACTKYGSKGIIVFRLITTLFLYLIPVVPDVYILLRTFFRILVPLLLYFIFESIYTKANYATGIEERKKNRFLTIFAVTVLILFIMLISCQFRYGIIVIGSKSMTGTINKGDAVIYKRYEGEDLKKGQIIIFDLNGIKTVHRIIDIRNIKGQKSIITKGDNNETRDAEYRSTNDINGVVRVRIKYIGLPTLWFRSLFDK